VVAVPALGPHFAYISSGTWSLVGMELAKPVLTEESRLANFTNEAGTDSTIRYLRNVTGLWLLQECLRSYRGRLRAAGGGRPGRGHRAGQRPDQARALGAAPGSLADMRALLRTSALRMFTPVGGGRAWIAAANRMGSPVHR
jgi:rhamnulokinase